MSDKNTAKIDGIDVEIKDDNSVMKAQLVRLNILTKDIEINSQDKIKIITN